MLTSPQPTASHGLSGFERADVHLNNVVKIFGLHNAVDNISLTMKSGKFFSLLGRPAAANPPPWR